MFCMVSFLSLFVYESHLRLSGSDPAIAAALSNAAQPVIARSRHSLKLFEDTKRGVLGQLHYFRDEIAPAHRKAFLTSGRNLLRRLLETDLGIYVYDQLPISSTHAATFHLGFEPKSLFNPRTGREVQAIAAEYGTYLSIFGVQLDPIATSFASLLDPNLFSHRDVRSESYYKRTFNGSQTTEINALLTSFRVSMNFVERMLRTDTSVAAWQTTFKIRYLTLYQILRSLQILRMEVAHQLTDLSQAVLRTILDNPESQVLTDPASKPFRNSLMHYSPDSRIPTVSLQLTAPLYGLVQACFPGHDERTISALVDRQAARTADALNAWGQMQKPTHA